MQLHHAVDMAMAMLERVDVLGIAAHQRLPGDALAHKVVGAGGRGGQRRGLELCNEGVEQPRGAGVLEQRRVKQLGATNDLVGKAALDEFVQSVAGPKVLSHYSLPAHRPTRKSLLR